MRQATEPTTGERATSDPVYHPAPTWKFVLLSLLTFGLYECYWMYKCWRYVRRRDNTIVTPLARAVFAPLFFPTLLIDLRKHSTGWAVSLVAIAICSLVYAIAPFLSRQADPYSLLGFISIVAMLPAVWRVNALNKDRAEAGASEPSWRLRHTLVALLGLPLFLYYVLLSLFLIPDDRIVAGERLWPHQRSYLTHHEVISNEEEVVYFYTTEPFSIADEGNLLTDVGVVSYWRDEESGELLVSRATHDEIFAVTPVHDEEYDLTRVTIASWDGSEFELWLPTHESDLKDFLEALSVRRAFENDDSREPLRTGAVRLDALRHRARNHCRTRQQWSPLLEAGAVRVAPCV